MMRKCHSHLLITIWFFCCSFFLQADLNTNIEDESRSFYGVSSQYESPENMVITCSTKVCSFGKQVVEKVEVRSRHLGARFPLAAVLSLQVFASRLCISRQNRSHASCQGDGYHRYKITQPLKWPCHRILLKICYICYFSFKSQFLRRCKYIQLLFLLILWVFWEAKES